MKPMEDDPVLHIRWYPAADLNANAWNPNAVGAPIVGDVYRSNRVDPAYIDLAGQDHYRRVSSLATLTRKQGTPQTVPRPGTLRGARLFGSRGQDAHGEDQSGEGDSRRGPPGGAGALTITASCRKRWRPASEPTSGKWISSTKIQSSRLATWPKLPTRGHGIQRRERRQVGQTGTPNDSNQLRRIQPRSRETNGHDP